jgi:hypothetical protein
MTPSRLVLRVSAVASVIAFDAGAGAPTLRAQSPAENGLLAFDVASVKSNKTQNAQPRVDMAGGRFTAINVTLLDLVRLAYPIQDRVRNDEQVLGGSNHWIPAGRPERLRHRKAAP